MLWKIGGAAVVLAVLLALGHLWFALVEGVLARVKGLLFGRETPGAWHPLPPMPEETDQPADDGEKQDPNGAQ